MRSVDFGGARACRNLRRAEVKNTLPGAHLWRRLPIHPTSPNATRRLPLHPSPSRTPYEHTTMADESKSDASKQAAVLVTGAGHPTDLCVDVQRVLFAARVTGVGHTRVFKRFRLSCARAYHIKPLAHPCRCCAVRWVRGVVGPARMYAQLQGGRDRRAHPWRRRRAHPGQGHVHQPRCVLHGAMAVVLRVRHPSAGWSASLSCVCARQWTGRSRRSTLACRESCAHHHR